MTATGFARSACAWASALLLTACAGSPPRFALTVPPTFSTQVTRRTFRQGVPLSDNAEVQREFPDNRAKLPTTMVYGQWTDPSFVTYPARGTYYGHAKQRGWSIEVQRGVSPEVARGLQAADGYAAGLGETLDASARIYPRFQHKRFSWGRAVSYLVQYQNDNTNYVPNNGMLQYEVHGVTDDGRYTVAARFGVTHPRLTEFGPTVRDYRDDASKPDSPMRRDRDYLLVEHCPDADFQPGLADIDKLVDGVRPGVSQ